MATLKVDGLEEISGKLARMENKGVRDAVKRIVSAGAEADAAELMERTRNAGHIRTGSMAENIRGGRYKETIRGGEIDVYPQGTDSKGVSNAMKAFVINYGYGKRRTKKTGDKFITGKQKAIEKAVQAAMEEEAEKIFREMGISE